jgi:N-acetylneuraminic acid mutarotase
MKRFLPRLILFVFVMAASSFTAQPSDSAGPACAVRWTKKCDMPGPLYAFDAATLGNKIYAIGGRGKEERHDRYTYVYDAVQDSWEIKKEPLFPSGKFKYDDRNDVFVYGPKTDTWQTRAPMPETRFISGVAVVKDKIIVITGVDGRGCRESKIFAYEPLKDRWHDLGKVPRNFMLAGVASVGDRFYILGGSDLENILFQCLEGTLLSRSEAQDQDGI